MPKYLTIALLFRKSAAVPYSISLLFQVCPCVYGLQRLTLTNSCILTSRGILYDCSMWRLSLLHIISWVSFSKASVHLQVFVLKLPRCLALWGQKPHWKVVLNVTDCRHRHREKYVTLSPAAIFCIASDAQQRRLPDTCCWRKQSCHCVHGSTSSTKQRQFNWVGLDECLLLKYTRQILFTHYVNCW